MELIQIIYDILLLGGGLLFFVIIVSFFLAKARQKEEKIYSSNKLHQNHSSNVSSSQIFSNAAQLVPFQSINLQREQSLLRKQVVLNAPQIFQIDQALPRSLKIVRKPTFRDEYERRDSREKYLSERKTDGNGSRYTVINENLKRYENRAANLYR